MSGLGRPWRPLLGDSLLERRPRRLRLPPRRGCLGLGALTPDVAPSDAHSIQLHLQPFVEVIGTPNPKP